MTDITITEDNKVKMTITYEESFNTPEEMREAVDGAIELRGLVAKPESELCESAQPEA